MIRAVTAAVLSFLITEAFALPQSYWAVVTALIIIQTSLGGTIAAGVDRFLGTLAGAVVGAIAALASNYFNLSQPLVLALTVAPLVLLASLYPSFRIAPVTAVIVLLATPSNASPVTSAMHRLAEIALGAIIGIAVSTVVLPSRARRIYSERSAELLRLLAQLLALHVEPPDAVKQSPLDRLNDRTLAELGKIGTAAQEARREHPLYAWDGPAQEQMLRALRRLRSDVAFVGRATATPDVDWHHVGPLLAEVASAFRSIVDKLCRTLLDGQPAPGLEEIDEAIARLKFAMGRGSGEPRTAVVLPFALDGLRQDIGELVEVLASAS